MKPLYNFGLSQEDPLTEIKGLDLADGDSLLCIAAAGEVPLSIAALKNVSIVAVDPSEDQLRLCRIKQQTAVVLNSPNAAGFLGYTRMPGKRREKLFNHNIVSSLNKDDQDFWRKKMQFVRGGLIHCGKFERFIKKASRPALWIIGRKNFYRLFDCNSRKEQEEIFDRFFAGILLKTIFKTVFHPWVYTNRGIDAVGMQHHKEGNIGDFFFNRFRNFCCSTPARDNFLLQYVFFRQSLFPGALPEYLKSENHRTFLQNQSKIIFVKSTMEQVLTQVPPGKFNKIQLSNIGDWISKESMAGILVKIQEKTSPGSGVVMRHIYFEHPVPDSVHFLKPNHELGEEIIKTDRFPFSSIVPILHINHERISDQIH